MDNLPFAASFEVLSLIVKQIREGVAYLKKEELVPTLSVCWNSSGWKNIPYEHYVVGWCPQQDVADATLVNVLGTIVFVGPETLKSLADKRLILNSLNSGGRAKPGTDRQFIVAVRIHQI